MTARASRPANLIRYVAGNEHVESWFFRANHPSLPRAIWLKATILGSRSGGAQASAWCSCFDGNGEPGRRAWGQRATVPFDQAHFDGDDPQIQVADCSFDLGATSGNAQGQLGELSWDLHWERSPGLLGEPLCLFPSDRLIDSRLPRNKLVTPAPVLMVSGHVVSRGQTWEIDQWVGMQGHNWGPAHSPEYAWGQCNFLNSAGEVFCTVEAAAGRVVMGGFTTPLLAMMTIRRGKSRYSFDRILDLWRQKTDIDFPCWSLRMRGPGGDAQLSMRAHPDRMVCLPYENPSGQISYCLNSKLASVSLRVNPVDEDGFVCESQHGGALEFLQPQPAPGIEVMR
ncbi:MAG: hypothetical protein GXP62_09955 [Oligoflexia bacterium]|nr:hypothetical protein [Oligoflexia bacterium]